MDARHKAAARIAQRIAAAMDAEGQAYALGGAIALGYWGEARGTVDVDVTVFLSPDEPSTCIYLMQRIGCEVVSSAAAAESIREHGFFRTEFDDVRVDVFLPSIDFYELARQRSKRVNLGDQSVVVWDAETLCVFKMMFIRRKDVADVEQMMRTQKSALDRQWIRDHLVDLYGERDPRIAQWDELAEEVSAD